MHFITTPPNPGSIIGRVQLLADIHTALRSGRPVALVHGIGGIGKTTAATAYAHHPTYSADYEAICWLEVTSSISAAFVSARALQQYLGVEERVERALLTPTFDNSPREFAAFTEVVEELHKCPARLLLLIDNANNEAEIRQIVPALQAPQLRVLVTSRADCEDLQPIRVEALKPHEAAQLFRLHYGDDRLPGEPERPEIFDLLASFDYHTLLTEMLAKIGRGMNYPLPDLLAHVRDLTLREEKWQIKVGTGLSGRTHRMGKETLKTYLAHLFREIKTLREEDTALLRRLAALPNRSHSTEQLAALLQLEGDAVFALRRQLAALDQQGIPLRDLRLWRLHPLFREVCLDLLAPFTAENCAPLAEVVAEMVAIDSGTKNWKEKFENQDYAEGLLRLIKDEKNSAVNKLQEGLAGVYWQLGRYYEAKSLFEQVLSFGLKNFGEQHLIVGRYRLNLSFVLRDLGDLVAAKAQNELVLITYLERFGENDTNVARCRSNLARVLQDLGDLKGARAYLELALSVLETNLKKNSPDLAAVRSNFANVLNALGDLMGAKLQSEMALSSDLETFGEQHFNVARSRSNLAMILQGLGDLQGSKAHLELALQILEVILGKSHTHTATVRSNLGMVLKDMGYLTSAKAHLEIALSSDLKNFGERHFNIAYIRSNLAMILMDIGDLPNAKASCIWRYQLLRKIVDKSIQA